MLSTEDAVLQEFRLWYQHQIPRLYNYVAYWVQDAQLADDLTASICEQAFKQLHRFDSHRGSFDAWMFGIARNALRMHFRTRSRHPSQVSLDALPEIRSSADSIEHQLELAERFQQVMQHFHRLSPQELEAVSLRYAAGLPNPEIASVMGIPANQVGVVLHRALAKLRAAVLHLEDMEG